MNRQKSGQVCGAKGCTNKTYNCSKSFFRFPRDIQRARIWAKKCGREDLSNNPETLYKSQRLCADHFEPAMFTNHLRKRLNPNAVPSLFPVLECRSGGDHNYCRPPLMSPKDQILENRVLVGAPGFSASRIQLDKQDETAINVYEEPASVDTGISSSLQSPSSMDINDSSYAPMSPISIDTESSSSLMSSNSTQTSSSLSFNSPRKVKYRNIISNLTVENERLKKRVEQLEHQLHDWEENNI